MNPVQIALPVMLHVDNEIDIFRKAQERLMKLGDSCGVPVEVGAFLLYLPSHSRKPENFAKQLANQEIHHLPIRLAETGVQRQNSLSYAPGDPTHNASIASDLESTMDQVARLRDLDPTAPEKLVVAPHVGIIAFDSIPPGDFSHPGFYAVGDFVEQRDEMYKRSKARFSELSKKASANGLHLALENAYSAVVEDVGHWQGQKGTYGLEYQVFNDLPSLRDISGGHLVLDLAHFAAMQNIPARFEANKDLVSSDSLFATLGISSWDEFPAKAGQLGDYLPRVRGFHFSSQDGLGIRVPKATEEGRRWGDGTGQDLTSMETYHQCLRWAQENALPVAIEEDYNIKPLTFNEADAFLGPILRSYKS